MFLFIYYFYLFIYLFIYLCNYIYLFFRTGKKFYCSRCRIHVYGSEALARHRESHTSSPSSEPGPSGIQPVVEQSDPSADQVDPSQEQMGGAEEVLYQIELSRVRLFARSAATESTYKVRFNNDWQGRRLRDIELQLRRLFEDLLARVREIINQNDLLRVTLRHDGLNHAVVVPLQAAGDLNVEKMLSRTFYRAKRI